MDKKTDHKGRADRKKQLIRTQSQTRRLTAIITIAIIIVIAVAYFVIDSRSYLATVNDNRIAIYEYKFLLNQQVLKTESEEGITEKHAEFWMSTEGGRNYWETAKTEALNASKDYMIQLIKAREIGMTIDATIKSEVNQILKQAQGQASEADFANYVKTQSLVTLDQYRKILENAKLIERFETQYIKQNYQAAVLSDEDLKKEYEKDTKLYDLVDFRYIYFAKTDDSGNTLPQDKLDEKKAKAEEALAKIQAGGDIEQIVKDYTEEQPDANDPTKPLGQGSMYYNSGSSVQDVVEFVFNNEVGDSGFVDNQYTYYVLLVTKRTGFDDVKANVKNYLEEKGKVDFYEKALDTWAMDTKYNIIKNNAVYDAIKYPSLYPSK